MLLNTGSGGIDIFEVKLTFDMLTVRGQQHSFWTHERVFLWKFQSFWDRKCLDLRGTRTPNLRIHAECSNLLSYQGQTFAVPCCWILATGIYLGIGKNMWSPGEIKNSCVGFANSINYFAGLHHMDGQTSIHGWADRRCMDADTCTGCCKK